MTPFQMVAFCLCSASCCFLAMMVAMRVAYKPESNGHFERIRAQCSRDLDIWAAVALSFESFVATEPTVPKSREVSGIDEEMADLVEQHLAEVYRLRARKLKYLVGLGISKTGPNWANPDMFDSCRKTVLDICSYLKKYQMKEVFDKCKWLFSRFLVEETYSETKQFELTGS